MSGLSFKVYREPCPLTSPLEHPSTRLKVYQHHIKQLPSIPPPTNTMANSKVSDIGHKSKLDRKPLSNITNKKSSAPIEKTLVGPIKQMGLKHPFVDEDFPPLGNQKRAKEENEDENEEEEKILFDIDDDISDNHLHCPEYINDILNHLRQLEHRYLPSSKYMTKQRELVPETRLVDWLIEIAQDYNFVSETVFLMINYIDRFMSKKNVMKSQLQILGLSAIFIASKYEEIDPVPVEDLITISEHAFNAKQIITMEEVLLRTLNFDLNVATTRTFATRFIKVAHHLCGDPRFSNLVYFLTELSLLDYRMLQYVPSQIALSAVVLALKCLRKRYWNKTIQYHTKYEFAQISGCINILHNFWLVSPTLKHNIVQRKYSRNEYDRVADLQPPQDPPHDPYDFSLKPILNDY